VGPTEPRSEPYSTKVPLGVSYGVTKRFKLHWSREGSRRKTGCYGGNMSERPEGAPDAADAAHEANDDYVPHDAEELREAAEAAKPSESDDSERADGA
jgi:hypothetical protein